MYGLRFNLKRSNVVRNDVRPLPKADGVYNEWLHPDIVYATATNYKTGTNDAEKRTGFYHETYAPFETIQSLMVPAKV